MHPADVGLAVMRGVVGLTMAAHGAQKAFGWWSGPGPAGWRGAMDAMGFRPGGLWALLSTAVELVGGLLLAAGLLTPLAAAALVAQLIVIIVHVHAPKGFWNRNSGFEFPLSLGAGAVAMVLLGPGSLSLDGLLDLSFDDTIRWGLLVLAVGAGVVALAIPRLATDKGTATIGRR